MKWCPQIQIQMHHRTSKIQFMSKMYTPSGSITLTCDTKRTALQYVERFDWYFQYGWLLCIALGHILSVVIT